ncbi:hypothetical protein SAMN04488063_0202 [Halopelagius inordinatus]|uniref:Uncharacterized protein n=1 Tax=Halopelagius inordinatus TaxID=553467 RepID=A0A1I2LE00_9EURY|nr:hypothetical protein [Halopelagius inordinatus]SFF76679.1 hypothetical protein SAMN04488063_0202 [Halopelagius inordinatus]
MSLPGRAAPELADLFRTALLWVGLLPAVSPIQTVVTAVPAVAGAPGWLSLVATAVSVGWLNYEYPEVSVLRVWAFGLLASLSLAVFSVVAVEFTTLGAADESWAFAAAYAVCWALAIGFALVVTSPRAREIASARLDPAARGRSD